MEGPYLSWWMAGLALGGLAVAQWLIERRTLGVSGFVQRTLQVFLRPGLARDESRIIHADPAELRAALLDATADEAGHDVPEHAPTPSAESSDTKHLARRIVTARAALLYVAAIVIGSAIATLQRGTWSISTTLGPRFEELWGDGLVAVLALFGGGVVVGIGTRMAGGCTSGHGLSGCSRFQIGSLAATATFMAGAVATTFLLRGLV
ncbi:MAG TPA: YeeE/YedE thiosulfate transporter family protein [Nannocystaceae bacterium]|nr:YeeE/YedE thiosulfate transporter family protein [Nannocystaceae bacterium]